MTGCCDVRYVREVWCGVRSSKWLLSDGTVLVLASGEEVVAGEVCVRALDFGSALVRPLEDGDECPYLGFDW